MSRVFCRQNTLRERLYIADVSIIKKSTHKSPLLTNKIMDKTIQNSLMTNSRSALNPCSYRHCSQKVEANCCNRCCLLLKKVI